MKTEQKNRLAGAFFLLSLLGLLIPSYRGSGFSTSGEGYQLEAVFGNVQGLDVGAPVLLAGVQIGHVALVDFDTEELNARVVLAINEGIPVPADSFLSIRSEGFFGARFMTIQPGGDFEMLEPGERFSFTQDSIDFLAVMNDVLTRVEAKNSEER